MKSDAHHSIRVSGYSGYKSEERPVAFDHMGRTLHVAEITERWVEEGASGGSTKWYFRVKADDDDSYLLFYDSGLRAWFLKEGPSLHPQNA